MGCLGSLETGKGEAEDGHGFEGELSTDMLLTDPEEAADFVAKTKVDALAIAIVQVMVHINLQGSLQAKFLQ